MIVSVCVQVRNIFSKACHYCRVPTIMEKYSLLESQRISIFFIESKGKSGKMTEKCQGKSVNSNRADRWEPCYWFSVSVVQKPFNFKPLTSVVVATTQVLERILSL